MMLKWSFLAILWSLWIGCEWIIVRGLAIPAENILRTKKKESSIQRSRRDENESVKGAFGRGVGFFIGEPCQTTCNSILFHVYCNYTTGQCECQEKYPINIDNRVCVKASKLGESCQYSESCAFYDGNSVCHPEGECRCAEGFTTEANHYANLPCVAARGTAFLYASDVTTLVCVVVGIMVFTIFFCLAVRLFTSRNWFKPREQVVTVPAPVVLAGMDALQTMTDSQGPSQSSGSTDFLPGFRRASYNMLAPPSSLGSRRPSSSSVRSQFSSRSHSSFFCYRDYGRRTLNSPDDFHLSHTTCRTTNQYSPSFSGSKIEPPEPPSSKNATNHI